MTVSGSSISSSSFPRDLELPLSTSNCSMDVSVLSVDSSCSSFSSMSQISNGSKPERKVHRKRPSSLAKFNQYNKGAGRWNNPDDIFGSARLNTVPYHMSSYNRLSNPKLQQMHQRDAAIKAPCRKCSALALNKTVADVPASVPKRKESTGSAINDSNGQRASAALNFRFRLNSIAKPENKNFEWSTSSTHASKSATLNALAFPPLVESVFSFNPPTSSDLDRKQRTPPPKPARKGSTMELSLLNSSECSCSHGQPLPPQPQPQYYAMAPPPIPSRKESIMAFDATPSANDIMPPPAMHQNLVVHPNAAMPTRVSSINSLGSASDPSNQSILRRIKEARPLTPPNTASSNNMFLAMPPVTPFEQRLSAITKSSACAASSKRRSSASVDRPPPLMTMPGFQRTFSSMSAPAVPQRKASMVDMNDCE